MQFKVGDKVKVIHNSNGSLIVKQAMNKIGIIESIHNLVYVKFNENVLSTISCVGFYKDEIKKVGIKNQQLLFDFME